MTAPRQVGRLEDGTPYFAPIGELVHDAMRERVCCHLCGGWYRALAPTHLRGHGWDHVEYKATFGLTPRRPLQVPALIERHRAVMRDLLTTQPSVRIALALAQERLRSGDLDAIARPARRGPQVLEHRRKSVLSARAASEAARARADAARVARMRGLGYKSVNAYLRQRYLVDRAPLEQIRRELGIGQTVLADRIKTAAISVRAGTTAATETKRAAKLRLLQTSIAPEGGVWSEYLQREMAEGRSQSEIAAQCGRSRAWVKHALLLLGLLPQARRPGTRRR